MNFLCFIFMPNNYISVYVLFLGVGILVGVEEGAAVEEEEAEGEEGVKSPTSHLAKKPWTKNLINICLRVESSLIKSWTNT